MPPWRGHPGDENCGGPLAEPGFSVVPVSPCNRLVLGSEGTLECCFEHEYQIL
jgi:hypothetical protein